MYLISLPPIGNVYIADHYSHNIRKVTVSTGIITTIAGTGINGYSGDNGEATSATLNCPYDVALDSSGTNIFIVSSCYSIVSCSYDKAIFTSRIRIINVSER